MKIYIDEKAIAYINHYAERLDNKLFLQLKSIDEKYKKMGLFCSTEHLNERTSAIKKAKNWMITEKETGIFETQRKQRLEEIGLNNRGRLVVNLKDGHTIYWTDSLKKYMATFKPRTNPYILLIFLVQNPGEIFSDEELVDKLNPQRRDANSADDRRIRDTIETIRKKLKLTKNPEDDFFTVDKGFGLNCIVELKS